MPTTNNQSSPSGLLLHDRLESIRQQIFSAAERSGRASSVVRLVAVTKTVAANRINDILSLGIRDVGENRVQEAESKRGGLNTSYSLTHHLIGHLQTNKAKKAVDLFDVIQSVDRLKLADMLHRLGLERGKPVRCLVELTSGNEASKTGCPMSQADEFLKAVGQLPGLKIEGIMTIGPLSLRAEDTRQFFKIVKACFDRHKDKFGDDPQLSMGMTDDFELAIEEGSTMVRIGRALFGPRQGVVPSTI